MSCNRIPLTLASAQTSRKASRTTRSEKWQPPRTGTNNCDSGSMSTNSSRCAAISARICGGTTTLRPLPDFWVLYHTSFVILCGTNTFGPVNHAACNLHDRTISVEVFAAQLDWLAESQTTPRRNENRRTEFRLNRLALTGRSFVFPRLFGVRSAAVGETTGDRGGGDTEHREVGAADLSARSELGVEPSAATAVVLGAVLPRRVTSGDDAMAPLANT